MNIINFKKNTGMRKELNNRIVVDEKYGVLYRDVHLNPL